jgi:hypothetical protein
MSKREIDDKIVWEFEREVRAAAIRFCDRLGIIATPADVSRVVVRAYDALPTHLFQKEPSDEVARSMTGNVLKCGEWRMSFGPQEICQTCGKINYAGRIVCRKCDRYDDEEAIPTPEEGKEGKGR